MKNNSDTARTRITVSDVRKAYTSEKARRDMTTQSWVYFVLRPLSFYITPFFINMRISANTATLLGLTPLFCGMLFILRGSAAESNFVIGAVLLNIWYLLDVIDGNIARFHNKASRYGALLDWFIGKLCFVLLHICLGIGLCWSSSTRSIFDFGLNLPGWFWLSAAAVGLITDLFHEAVSLKGQVVVGEKIANKVESKISFWTILPRAIISSQLPALLVAAIVGALGIYIVFYALYKVLVLSAMVGLSLRKAFLADRRELGT